MTAPDWPAGLTPDRAPVHTRNELLVPLPPARVWQRLVAAPAWPDWYAGARDVALPAGRGELGPGVVFDWTTLGVRVRCRVDLWRPYAALGWSGRALGSTGHHRWLLTAEGDGTRVVTEEVQAGPVPAVGRWWLRRSLLGWHQRWLAGLAGGPGTAPGAGRPVG
ncbi:SRPBCC family protein [Micromonospora siamensis]|uniref:Polyketide cyclase / dehydrase and lipid transport n=1 Tax=Micromonospora siamensis TaxID=299152 RepID=A0A1C5JTW7_9ACTN|nr:SRPBCC family protein [Micromonospora siamensis]SCG73933.1 Polyketide cyclase / dehydrase and lipid transport [Micromonospora siamensis]